MFKLIIIVLIAVLVYLVILIINSNGPTYQETSLDMNKLHFSYEDATKVAESLRL